MGLAESAGLDGTEGAVPADSVVVAVAVQVVEDEIPAVAVVGFAPVEFLVVADAVGLADIAVAVVTDLAAAGDILAVFEVDVDPGGTVAELAVDTLVVEFAAAAAAAVEVDQNKNLAAVAAAVPDWHQC